MDLISLSAHKIGGPKGIGALYVRPDLRNLRPLLAGGGQEERAALRHRGHRPDSRLCQGRGAAAGGAGGQACPHGPASRPTAVERLLSHPRRGAGGQRRGAPHPGGVPGGLSQCQTSSTIWAVRASACPPAPPVTGARPAGGYAALGLDKRTAAGVLRLSFGPETTEGDIDAAVRGAAVSHKNTRFSML